MARNKNRKFNRLNNNFVIVERDLLRSPAYQGMKATAKVGFLYFKIDSKTTDVIPKVVLTFPQATKYGLTTSSTTFDNIKKELVERGILDPFESGGGGEGKPSKFLLSDRWKAWGHSDFKQIKYRPGIGSKNFRAMWKDKKGREKLEETRRERETKKKFTK